MSKFSKTILIITVIGIALCSIGLAFGANYGIYLNKTGWHPVPKVAKEITRTFEDVKTINANYQNSAIEVIPGSEFSVTAKYAFAEPQIVYENGTLTIDSSENHTWFNIGFMFTVEKLTITVPGNASLDGINIYNDNGSIKVSNKIFAKNFVIQNDNGSIKIDGVTAEEAKVRNKNGSIALANFAGINCKVSNDNGAIKLENFASVTGDIRNENGSITGDNIKGKNEFKNENGSIKISAENLSDFYIEAYNENGSCKVNGEKIKRPIGDPNSENQIIAENQNGSIKILGK